MIETHGMSTQGQRLPSAMELSLHKIQRERQMAQALIEQRQLSNYGLNAQNVNMSYIFVIVHISCFYLKFRVQAIQCLNQ